MEAATEPKRPLLLLLASFLLLAYGGAATWCGWTCQGEPVAVPFWCRYWLCGEEQLAQAAYAQLWEGETGRMAALRAFEQSLARDPASPRRWCDLGEALLESDQDQRASYCFAQAVERAPNSPMIRLRTANFYFRTRETERALEQMSHVLRSTNAYDDLVFSAYSKFVNDMREILKYGIPEERRAAQSYLRYLLAQRHVEEAGAVWDWMRERSFTDDLHASAYVAALLETGSTQKAAATWSAYLGPRRRGYREANFVFNGDFESDPSGCQLDWAIAPVRSVEVIRDREVRHDGAASLRVRFDGTENLDYNHVSQAVVLSPGQYRLQAWLRADGISTDQGIAIHALDPKAPSRVDVRTPNLTGTAPWKQVEVTFPVTEEARMILVQVARPASRMLDNKIRGTVWIDGVTLERLDGPDAHH